MAKATQVSVLLLLGLVALASADHGTTPCLTFDRILTASFDAASSNGAEGYFHVCQDDETTIYYNLFVDLTNVDQSNLPDGCELSELTYHIHTMWQPTNASATSGANDQCGFDQTGNHYDPTFACGPASEHANSFCGDLNRNASSYQCGGQGFKYVEDPYACEVGDLSGKHGKLEVQQDANGGNYVRALWEDNYAWYPSQEWTEDMAGALVLHCAGGERVLCAKLYNA